MHPPATHTPAHAPQQGVAAPLAARATRHCDYTVLAPQMVDQWHHARHLEARLGAQPDSQPVHRQDRAHVRVPRDLRIVRRSHGRTAQTTPVTTLPESRAHTSAIGGRYFDSSSCIGGAGQSNSQSLYYDAPMNERTGAEHTSEAPNKCENGYCTCSEE